MATSKQPVNHGRNTHDGKNFHMFAKGTRSKKHFKYPKGRRSGRSCSEEYPDGERRK